MFRQEEYFIIMSGNKVLCVSDDDRVFWANDLRFAYRFKSNDEADIWGRKHIIAQIEGPPSVGRMIVQYINMEIAK